MTKPDSPKGRIEDDELLSLTPVKLQHAVFFSVAASSRLSLKYDVVFEALTALTARYSIRFVYVNAAFQFTESMLSSVRPMYGPNQIPWLPRRAFDFTNLSVGSTSDSTISNLSHKLGPARFNWTPHHFNDIMIHDKAYARNVIG